LRKALFILGIGSLILLTYGLFLYFQPVKNISKQDADFSLSQKQLTDEFSSDAQKADTKYKNKIIEISGIVKKTETNNPNSSIIFDEGGNFLIVANAQADKSAEFKTLQPGDKVIIKGIYSGYIVIDDMFMIPAEIKIDKCSLVK
jgi:hypothetical protein